MWGYIYIYIHIYTYIYIYIHIIHIYTHIHTHISPPAVPPRIYLVVAELSDHMRQVLHPIEVAGVQTDEASEEAHVQNQGREEDNL
jgi:hypothetical protein